MVHLDSERLRLRNFRAEDWMSVCEWATDPQVTRFMDPQPKEKVVEWVKAQSKVKDSPDRKNYCFAVVVKEDDKVIGDCQLDLCSAPYKPNHGQVHYCINRKYWNMGFATEAVRAVLKFGFEELGLHRVQCNIISDNVASLRVVEKVRMRKEAFFVKDTFVQGEWRDSVSCAMLGSEWKASGF